MNGTGPRWLKLSPSRTYAVTILAMHATAAACILAVIPGFTGIALAFLVAALGCVVAWERALLLSPYSPRAIELPVPGLEAAAASVVLANGQTLALRAARGIGVTRHWVALRPRALAGRSVLVTSGMLAPAAHRALRLWALWGRAPGVVPAQLPA